jgi:hypothetical protein
MNPDILKLQGLINVLAEKVGECSRCGKVGGDDWSIGAEGYTRRWTNVAELCDGCFSDLQRWVDDGGK